MRKITFFFALAGMLLSGSLSAQKNYADITPSSKTPVLQEDFNNNEKEWPLETTGEFVRKIQDGFFILENSVESAKLVHKNIPFDYTRNFEIEASIRYVSGKESTGHALLWGKTSEKDFGFYFTALNSFKICKYDADYVDFNPFTSSTALKMDAANKFTIRKVSGMFYFFINETPVFSMAYQPVFGNYVGFQVGSLSTLKVDYLYMSYLPDVKKPAKYNGCDAYSWIKGKTTSSVYSNDFTTDNGEWKIEHSEVFWGKVENGKYYMETLQEEFYSSWRALTLDAEKDFQIEASVKVAGGESYENGLIWGGSSEGSYRFGITGNGYYTIYKMEQGAVTDIADYTESSLITKEYNKLTVRKCWDTYYFFINDTFVMSSPFQPFLGDRVGFLVGKKGIMLIDSLRVIQF